MPRRPKKLPDHLFKPGQSGNPAGRLVGSKNAINEEIRQAFSLLLYNQLPNLEAWLEAAAKKDPIKAADLMLRVSERFLPSLQRTEITGAEGQAFAPITINLPNIPQFNVPTSIGEGASASLLTSPGEGIKEIPESVSEPTEVSGEPSPSTDVTPQFTIPKFELSANILRDIQETGGTSPE
jgi:hypothetical protein